MNFGADTILEAISYSGKLLNGVSDEALSPSK
jgi:hypothetical protein